MIHEYDNLQVDQLCQQIQDAGAAEAQRQEASRIMTLIEHVMDDLKQKCQEIRALFLVDCERRNVDIPAGSETFTIEAEKRLARRMRIGSVAAIILHAVLSAYSAWLWFDLPPQWAIGAGVLIGILISVMCKTIIMEYLFNQERPRPTRRLLQRIVMVSFVACFICLVCFMATRNPTDAWVELSILLMNGSLALLELLLPIFAGARLALAYEFEWSQRYDDEYRAIRQKLAELDSFMEWARTRMARSARISVMLPLMLSLMVLFSCVAQAQTFQIWVDDSTSMSKVERTRGAHNLRDLITPIIAKGKFRKIEVIHFWQDPWLALKDEFIVPAVPVTHCPEIESARKHRTIFKAGNQLKLKAEEKCRKLREQATQAHLQNMSRILDAVMESLLKASTERSGCTAIYDLLGRISLSQRDGVTIILTDAIETCRPWRSSLAKPSGAGKTIVLLAPGAFGKSAKGRNYDSYLDRKKRLERVAPWVNVGPFFIDRLDMFLEPAGQDAP